MPWGQFTRSPGWWLKRSIFLLRRFQLPVGCACSLVQDIWSKPNQTIFEGFPFCDLWDMLFVLIFMLPPKPSNVNTIFLTSLRITDKINMYHPIFSANVMVERITKCGAAVQQSAGQTKFRQGAGLFGGSFAVGPCSKRLAARFLPHF
jgi:hypothetical protein